MTVSQFAGMGGHHSPVAKTDEWLTPPFVIEALGGWASFDLDPCTPIVQPYPTARHRFTVADNGLIQAWDGRVWLNPPYGAAVIGKWLARMAGHGCGTALIFARTETDAFFRHVWDCASAVFFLRGRLNFHHVTGERATANSGAPSVLCAYGPADADFLAYCGLAGQFVPLRFPRGVLVAAIAETWLGAVAGWLQQQRGPVALADLYHTFTHHPKARANPNYQAKIRQVLQQGPFRRVRRGQWELAL